MLKIEIDEETGKCEVQVSGSLIEFMTTITGVLHYVYYGLESVEEKEVFHMVLKDIVDKQIYIKDEDELDEDEVIERDRKFNRIINEMEEEK